MAARKSNARSRSKPARKAVAKRPAKRTAPGRAAATRSTVAAKRGRVAASRADAAAGAAMAMNAPNGKPAVNGIGLTHHHLDFTSHDVEGVRRFYAEVLGFKNVLYVPEQGYLTVMISPTSSAGFMAPMPGPPEAWRPPGEPCFYFFVEDVDAAAAALEARGVTIDQPPADMPWGHRLASFKDPEGRMICIARNLR